MTLLVSFILLIIAISGGFLFWYMRKPDAVKDTEISAVEINDRIFNVELAVTPQEQAKGLQHKNSLVRGTGMLFIFPTSKKKTFHMRNMNFLIDIIWIREDWVIAGVERGAEPGSKLFRSPEPVKYVLEVNAGEADNFSAGDLVKPK